MEIEVRHVKGVAVIDVGDKVTLGQASGKLLSAVHLVLEAGTRDVLLNLADVNFIDSFGLGQLVTAFTTVKDAGGRLKLLNLTKKVKDLLVITKLLNVFEVEEDEEDAVASFA